MQQHNMSLFQGGYFGIQMLLKAKKNMFASETHI